MAGNAHAAQRAAGFTLLEVLVALAVLAAALGALVAGVSQTTDNAARLREKTFAHWVAVNKITEVKMTGSWPRIGISKGTVDLAEREWHWTLNIAGTPDQDLLRLTVEVRQQTADQPVVATMVGFLGRYGGS